MLTQAQNERLTQVGPGTPMGELMRRYWHPIIGSSALNEENPTKEIRLLGENLVLFRSAAGKLGLIEPSCPHRKANLSYGVPELEGIRCAYHGWLFDEEGNCVDQPSEPAGSRFKEKVKLKAYKAQERGGRVGRRVASPVVAVGIGVSPRRAARALDVSIAGPRIIGPGNAPRVGSLVIRRAAAR